MSHTKQSEGVLARRYGVPESTLETWRGIRMGVLINRALDERWENVFGQTGGNAWAASPRVSGTSATRIRQGTCDLTPFEPKQIAR